MEPVEQIKSQPSGIDKELWYRFQVQEQQEIPKRFERAAKFLVTIISISLTLFLSLTGKDAFTGGVSIVLVVLLGCWFLSLSGAFFVLFPFRYKYSQHRVQSYIDAHQKIIKVKRFVLIISLLFYTLALFMLALYCF